MLGEAELLSCSRVQDQYRRPTFLGGVRSKDHERTGSGLYVGWSAPNCLILPSLGGKGKPHSLPEQQVFTEVAWPSENSQGEGG